MGVPLVSPSGSVEEVPLEYVDVFKTRGYTPVSQGQELADVATQAQAPEATIGGAITAGATSALGGLTGGLSDVALRGVLSKGDLEYVAQQRNLHPIVSGIGNVGGAIAGAALTGGENLEGEAALGGLGEILPSTRIAELGTGIKTTIGEAMPGTLGSIAGMSAEGAAVGALQNVGNYVSDVALGNRDLSAESFLAEVGNGAKWGGLAGGALGTVERGLISARRLFPRSSVGSAAEGEVAHGAAMDQIASATDTADDTAKAAREEVDRIRAEIARTHNEAKVTGLNLQAARAEQEVEVEKALQTVRAAKASARTVAAADVPAEVAGTAAASADGAQAVENALADRSAGAGVAADAAHAALDSATASQIEAAGARATKLEQLADEVERTGKEVRALSGREMTSRWRAKYPDGAVDYDAANAAVRRGKLSEWAKSFEPVTEEDAAVKAYFESPQDPLRTTERIGGTDVPAAVKKIATGAAADASHDAYITATAEKANLSGSGTELMARSMYEARRAAARAMDDVYTAYRSGEPIAEISGRLSKPKAFVDVAQEGIEKIGAHERAHADLVRELGPAAPPMSQDLARGYDAAVEQASQKHSASVAAAIDDAAKTGGDVENLDDARKALQQHRDRLGKLKIEAKEHTAATARTRAEQEARLADAQERAASQAPAAKASDAPAAKTGLLNKLSNLGAVLEAARTVGVPGIPNVHDIPVVGPVLSLFLKAKAVSLALGKAGGKLPETIEARVAGHAATAQDKIAAAVDLAIRGTPAARRAVELAAPRVGEALTHAVFGSQGKKSDADLRELAAQRADDLATAVSNPDATDRSLRALVPTSDPALGSSLSSILQRKLQYLQDHAPPRPAPDPMGTKPAPIATAEAEKFARIVRAAEHPMSILDDLRDGTLTADAADAVRTIYPNLYAHIQQRVLESAMGNEVPYRTRVRLSVLFNGNLDPSLAHLPELQKSSTPTPSPAVPTQPPAPSVSGSPNLVSLYQTSADRRAAK